MVMWCLWVSTLFPGVSKFRESHACWVRRTLAARAKFRTAPMHGIPLQRVIISVRAQRN